MLITKTPFRVSFCGGGSDLPSFYEQYGGCVLSTAINQYMYIAAHPYFEPDKTVLKYSKIEIVDDLNKIDHKIFHCILNELQMNGLEITCTSDIPAGTGLGSSSAFTVGLLHTLLGFKGEFISKQSLAARACEVEIEKLGSPIGKQDQYAVAIGGLNFIRFHQNGTVSYEPIIMKEETRNRLQSSLLMFYLGDTRSANEILKEQKRNAQENENNLIAMCALAENMKNSLQNDDLSVFGDILDESWQLKRTLASGISNAEIDDLYKKARQVGAAGGKLLGAGGGGFLLFFCEPEKQAALKQALKLRSMPVTFDYDGTTVIYTTSC